MRVAFEVFRSRMRSWETLFQEACDFAEDLPEGRLINISHSEDQDEGVVVVWYYAP